uniref:RNA polymerase II transcription factor B subunit 2 n=1 Tax=Musa acuminata subsp. malaccensis TaxID=214687 RepID=A0A804IHA1_MUSAM|nr:PREDICTED: RNA polymerase II transcription factor B subunit 2 isoform X2 [Musa acuminata subsp. malaccensis]
MPQVRIIAKNFMDLVAALPAMKLDKLYESTFICEAVLRSLPPMAKRYVLQMLYIDTLITAKSMEEWLLPDGLSKHKVAIDRLLQLRVFLEVTDRKKETSYKINPKFQSNIQKYLVSGGTLPREPMPLSITVRLPTLEDLETYASEQWECFLLQLINSAQAEKLTSFSSSMIKICRENEPPKLTENGFQFLLMDTNAQLWYIIREYISTAEDRGVDPTDLISFLLELSFHTLGEAYNLNTLTDVQRIAIKDLADLGLVKLQQGRKESWFIPTKLATNLSASFTDSSSNKEGFVVVETNFRMYAYSTSKLYCEILRLFSRIEYQLPNLLVGAITKESLYNAFENGITADQVEHYQFCYYLLYLFTTLCVFCNNLIDSLLLYRIIICSDFFLNFCLFRLFVFFSKMHILELHKRYLQFQKMLQIRLGSGKPIKIELRSLLHIYTKIFHQRKYLKQHVILQGSWVDCCLKIQEPCD